MLVVPVILRLHRRVLSKDWLVSETRHFAMGSGIMPHGVIRSRLVCG
jgi:hypothetical protein